MAGRQERQVEADTSVQFSHPRFSRPPTVAVCPAAWGMHNAVDMIENKTRWQVPLGSFDPASAALP